MKKLLIILLSILMLTACHKEPPVSEEELYYQHVKETVENNTLADTHYYYQQLTDEQKEIYVQVYEVLSGQTEMNKFFQEVHVRDYTIATHFLYLDMPLYFYSRYLTSNFVGYTAREVVINEAPEAGVIEQLDQIADNIISTMPSGLSDYEKVKWIFDWVCENTEYNLESENNQDIRSVLLNGESVCAGYARTFQLLCQKVGIETGYITGAATNSIQDSDFHAWCFVKLNDQYYWVDPTWGDKYYFTDYSYMCITDEDLFKTRNLLLIIRGPEFFIGEDIIPVPNCTDASLNYFKMNDCYFASYDKSAFESFIIGHKEDPYFLCQFDPAELSNAMDHLMDNEEIFDALFAAYPDKEQIGIYYMDDEVTGTLYIQTY